MPSLPGSGSLEHILSCHPRALEEGRYHWRHDQVLQVIAEATSSGISTSKQPTRQSIAFVRAGEKPQQLRSQTGGLLATARNRKLKVDLGRQLKFPENIAVNTLRPDMVLVSEATRQVVVLELTVPGEDQMEEASERKRAKYEELAGECRSRGWRTQCNPIEVGCRGFVGQSLIRAPKMLGDCRTEEPSKTSLGQLKRCLDVCGSSGAIHGPQRPLRHKLGLDRPGWVSRARVSVETRNTL